MVIENLVNSQVAKYQQIQQELKKAILDGTFKVGDRFPAERDLANMFSVSTFTVRQALSILENDGMIVKVPTRGTFVSQAQSKEEAGAVSGNIMLLVAEMPQADKPSYNNYVQYFDSELRTLSQQLFSNGRSLILSYTNSVELAQGCVPTSLDQNAVAGVFLDGWIENYHIAVIQERKIPIVVIGNRPIHLPVSRVTVNYEKAAYLSTQSLLELNKGPVILVTEAFDNYYSHDVLRGYASAMTEANQEMHIETITSTGRDITEMTAILKRNIGTHTLLLNCDVASTLLDLYPICGHSIEDNPFIVMCNASNMRPAILQRLNYCAPRIDQPMEAAVDLMEHLLRKGEPKSISLEPTIKTGTVDGEFLASMEWSPVDKPLG